VNLDSPTTGGLGGEPRRWSAVLKDYLYQPDGRLRSFWRFVISAVFVLFANVMCGVIAAILARGLPGSGYWLEIFYRSLLVVVLVAGFWLMLRGIDWHDGDPLLAMGLGFRDRWLRDIVLGTLVGTALIAAGYAVLFSLGYVKAVTLHVDPRSLRLSAAVLVILPTAAMAEEIAFRGYPFQRLAEAIGPAGAAGALSLLFAAVHLGNPDASIWAFLNTALAGIWLSVAYLRTHSLWLPFGLHFGWNAGMGYLFGMPVSGIRTFSVVVRSKLQGPAWLTGGSYGLEAGALGTVLLLIAIAILFVFVRQRPVRESGPGLSVPASPPAPVL